MWLRTPKDLGAFIRERRGQLGWTQQTLAARVGVSRPWIVGLEGGKATAHLGLVLRTLKELEVTLDASIGLTMVRESAPAIDLDQVIQRARGGRS